jgi:hypothetical protein
MSQPTVLLPLTHKEIDFLRVVLNTWSPPAGPHKITKAEGKLENQILIKINDLGLI